METTLTVAPVQWARLKELGDIPPINGSDLECMAEVREILKKHGKNERFGLALLHTHFPMNDCEMLVEETHKDDRKLTIKAMNKEEAHDTVPTVWMLMDGENRAILGCPFCYPTARKGDIVDSQRPEKGTS